MSLKTTQGAVREVRYPLTEPWFSYPVPSDNSTMASDMGGTVLYT
jgi:hypothetical protein